MDHAIHVVVVDYDIDTGLVMELARAPGLLARCMAVFRHAVR